MPSLVQTSRTALAVLNLFFLVVVGSELVIRGSRPAYTGDRATGSNLSSRAVLILGVGFALFAAFNLDMTRSGPLIAGRSRALFWVGLGVGVAGVVLRRWAVASLGRFFQLDLVVQEQHKVVRSGPYRVLRHPSYAGFLLTCVGIGLALGRWASLAVLVVVPTAAFVHRILLEERMLLAGLGDDYAQYRKRTWRLVPGLW